MGITSDSMARLSRRALHRQALAWALAPWSLVPQARAQTGAPRWRQDPFALGVASGQPQASSVVLWTRLLIGPDDAALAQQALTVRCELFADEALRQPLRQWSVSTDASRGHSVHVLAEGLPPGRPFWYRFVCGSAQSRVGRTRTAPAPGQAVARLRMALASCQHFEQGHYVAHREMATEDLDLVLFVGDYLYESSNKAYQLRRHRGGIPTLLEEYRDRHAQYKSDPDLQACHAAHPWVMTWDDHEVVNDYANDRDVRFTDPAVFLRRRAAAYQAYFEHMPVRVGPLAQAPHQMRIHDQLLWGRLAQIWTLDTRQYRDHHACPDPLRGGGRPVVGCDAVQDPARSLLGEAQEAWLTQGLRQGGAQWSLIGQSTLMASAGLDTPLGRTHYTDGWDGYVPSRDRLLATIEEARLKDVVVLGGDVHAHFAAVLRRRANDPASPVLASELVCTSVSSRGPGAALLSRMQAANPDLLHARGDERGYIRLDITPQALHADMRGTPAPALPGSVLRSQARWVVPSGQAGPQRAA